MIHSKSYYGSANSIIAEELGISLTRLGFQTTVISISPYISYTITTENPSPNFTRVLLPYYNKYNSISNFIKRGFDLLNYYRYIDADVILSIDPILPETFLPLLVGMARRIPVVTHLTDNWGIDPDRSRHWVEGIIEEVMIFSSLKLVKQQLYSSGLVRSRMKRYTTNQGVVIQHGFDDREFLNTDHHYYKGWINKYLQIPKENKVVLSSLDFRLREIYIRVARQIKSEKMNVTLVLINVGSEFFDSNEIDDLISEGYLRTLNRLERNEYIQVTLNSDVLWISAADSFWDRARYPARLSEYMATGNPIVCSLGGTAKEFLIQSGYAPISEYAFPINDVSSILHSFSFMMSDDPRIFEATNASFKYAKAHLTWDKIALNVANILNRLIEETP